MPAPRIIDIAPLERLLHLAGVAGSSDLIAALLGDLRATRSGLETAWNGPDFAALRAHAHVLIALAGTIGDTDLQTLAQRLNTMAHAKNIADLMDMKPNIMAGLGDLITVVDHRLAGSGG